MRRAFCGAYSSRSALSLRRRTEPRSSTSGDTRDDASVQVDDDGWTAEFSIPLSVLDVEELSGAEWGLQFTRVVETRGETIVWRPVDQTRGWTASFGRMLFDTP